MALGKWIGAALGFANFGPLGALAGYAIGALFDSLISGGNSDGYNTERIFNDSQDSYGNNSYGNSGYDQGGYSNNGYSRRQPSAEEERNSFLFCLMVLSAHVIQADGKIMHSEMELVRQFLRTNFGETAVSDGEAILRKLFDYRKQKGEQAWQNQIYLSCQQMASNMPEEHRLQLLYFLADIAKADGNVDNVEIEAIREVCVNLGINAAAVEQIFSLGGTSLDDAYKVLGLTANATDDELRKAYRKLALQYHPDRVQSLGEDVRKAAEKKFQELNEAKERIWKARGL